MKQPVRLLIAAAAAFIVGFGFMTVDDMRDAAWEVSPQEIEQAKANGKMGVESRPGSVTVLPIRSETADFLPIKWVIAGLAAGFIAFRATGEKKVARI